MASGPAAATMALRDAIARSEAVGAGGGDQVGVSWTLASPAIGRNPRRCENVERTQLALRSVGSLPWDWSSPQFG